MRRVLLVGLLLVAACGDAADVTEAQAEIVPSPTFATGPVDEWCAALLEVDPTLPLFTGAAIRTGTTDGVRATTEAIAASYDRLAKAPPAAIASDMHVVRDGYASFRDDLEVVDYEYEKVFAAIGQRPWQMIEFTQASRRVADFAREECRAQIVGEPTAEPDPIGRQFLVDALVDTGLTPDQAGCLADALGPDLGAGAAQPMAFEDAMAACGVTFEDFVPDP